MFSLQPRDELEFGASDYMIPQSDNIGDDLLADQGFIQSHTSIINFNSTTYQQEVPVGLQAGPSQRQTRNRDVYGNSTRVLHRDLERKRRQEMSHLYGSLRSLLPIEFIKGKRSICDHMHEATNYIKILKSNIQESQIRRDKLKEFHDQSSNGNQTSNDGHEHLPNLVSVNPVRNGLEILINCSLMRNIGFGLSKVLLELLERDINVVSCVSTETDGRFLHKIQAEASDLKSLDLVVLKERLSHICGRL